MASKPFLSVTVILPFGSPACWVFLYVGFHVLQGRHFSSVSLPSNSIFSICMSSLQSLPKWSSSMWHAFLPLVASPHALHYNLCIFFGFVSLELVSRLSYNEGILVFSDSAQKLCRLAHLLELSPFIPSVPCYYSLSRFYFPISHVPPAPQVHHRHFLPTLALLPHSSLPQGIFYSFSIHRPW